MNSMIGMNFLFGYLVARDRPQNEAIMTGLTASLFPANNLVGPVLLKTQVDKVKDLEEKKAQAEVDAMTSIAIIMEINEDDVDTAVDSVKRNLRDDKLREQFEKNFANIKARYQMFQVKSKA